MYDSWTKNVVLWRNFLGFIWDMQNVLMIIITEFERKVDLQNHPFVWLRFENRFFLTLNNDDEKFINKFTVN